VWSNLIHRTDSRTFRRHKSHDIYTTMSTKIVDDGLIQKASLYKPVFWLFRLDVLPFVVLYLVFFSFAMNANTTSTYVGLIALPVLFSVHLFLFLMAQWSVRVRCALGYKLVKEVDQAEIVHITAAQNAGMDRLVKLLSNNYFAEAKSVTIMNKSFDITRERLDFQKVVYNFDSDKNTFARLDYPTRATVQNVLSWRGHNAAVDVGLSQLRWGANEYDIPIPNFLDLYLVSHHSIFSECPFCLNSRSCTAFSNKTNRITWSRHSLCSRCCACSYGAWTTTGTTACSRC